MPLDVTRRQVLAYRTAAHGLQRDAATVVDLDVLDLGVQDTNVDSARLALAARAATLGEDPLTDPAFAVLWSVRGAPHLHRVADLPGLATALWPVSDADAFARLAAERAPLKAAGIGGVEAFETGARAMREVVTAALTKGEVSAGVTARLPPAYSRWCDSCRATHVYGGLSQHAGVFAGVRLLPDRSPTTLAPLDEQPPLPPEGGALGDLVRGYLRLHGPATVAEAAAYLGSSRAALRPVWPHDLVEVRVDGRTAAILDDRVDALRTAAVGGDVVRLLPPGDPFLQSRDRDLVVPDPQHRKALWRPLGNPGAVLVDGEIAGVWRARARGPRLDLTITAFDGAAAVTRAAIEVEAERVAAVRRATDVRVRHHEG